MLVYQDFKDRSVSIIYLLTLALSILVSTALFEGISLYGSRLLLNGTVLLLQFLLIWVYFCIRAKRIIFIVGSHIGLGDLLFLFAVAPFFSLYGFLFYVLVGLFFCLITYPLLLLNNNRLIPLAGVFSVVLFIYCATKFYLPSVCDSLYTTVFIHFV